MGRRGYILNRLADIEALLQEDLSEQDRQAKENEKYELEQELANLGDDDD